MKEKTGILFVQLSDETTYKFTNKLKENILSSFPSLTSFEIDNHSDRILIDYALKFVDLFEEVIVVIQSESQTHKISSLNLLFKHLSKKKHLTFVDNSDSRSIFLMLKRERAYCKDLDVNEIEKLLS